MRQRGLITIVVASFLAAACENSPTGSDGESLTVDFSIAPDHIHTYETEAAFTVLVTNQKAQIVADFDTLAVEVRPVGTERWKRVLLTSQPGAAFKGTHVFTASGGHNVRVVGRRRGQGSSAVLHQLSQPLQTVRWHADVGGYRVEFEGYPGDPSPGTQATVRFWVMQVVRDAAGNRPPITGLAALIQCTEAGGMNETHSTTETEPGVYQADHMFHAAGGATATLRFTGTDGAPAGASVTLQIEPGR